MIEDIELREISVDTGVPVGTVEKDLAITCTLLAVSETELRDHLAFKGGTAIKKAYYPDSRFSEDLDFTVTDLDEKEAAQLLEALSNAEINSITFGEVVEDGYTREGVRYRLPFTGPLDYRNSVRIDLSFRDDVILGSIDRRVYSSYSEDLSSTISCLRFPELMAEKIRAAMTRENPRDYYDMWAHLNKIDDKDTLRSLAQRKCAATGYPYDPSNIFEAATLRRIDSAWKTQLKHLIPDYVDFATILPQLKEEARFMFAEDLAP